MNRRKLLSMIGLAPVAAVVAAAPAMAGDPLVAKALYSDLALGRRGSDGWLTPSEIYGVDGGGEDITVSRYIPERFVIDDVVVSKHKEDSPSNRLFVIRSALVQRVIDYETIDENLVMCMRLWRTGIFYKVGYNSRYLDFVEHLPGSAAMCLQCNELMNKLDGNDA